MKKIFISGISSGLGKALAEVFSDTNWEVIGCGRSEVSFSQKNIHYFVMHIDNWNEVEDFVEHHTDLLEGISVLINNASILGMLERIDQYPPVTWKKVMDVNLNGSFHLIRALFPFLEKQTLPQIINISSSVGRKPRKEWGAYSVSKYALEGLTKILTDENPDFLIYTINPGGLPTRMRQIAYPEEDPSTLPSLEDAAIQIHHFVEFPDTTWKAAQINLRDYLK
jgi:NAD(P)-dependent dehydrogenase (short-subunit alcohol dehydrogenase family)